MGGLLGGPLRLALAAAAAHAAANYGVGTGAEFRYEPPVVGNYSLSSWFLSFPPENGAMSGLKVVGKRSRTLPPSLLCVPPKCGSRAVMEVLRGSKLEWWGEKSKLPYRDRSSDPRERPAETHEAVTDLLTNPRYVRVAIVRHPVERIISSLRAFGTNAAGCRSCVKAAKSPDPAVTLARTNARYLHYATHELAVQQALDCDEQRLHVNQHFRSLRCFCGFAVSGAREMTTVLLAGRGADMARLPGLYPDAEDVWTSRRRGVHKNLTAVEFLSSENRDETTAHASNTDRHLDAYTPALIGAIYAAVEADLAFFRGGGIFTDRGPLRPPLHS